ncbi:GNAT family N-acetyltransferase [Azospirillum sp. B4]|uniref:GNAT family N-acetyltransferase n=1 Tax=Azospirillum sp. B4 TaxID=95605 RepID=UPI00034BBD85|nr:GNAT family protein [Azospirillum sp. B4]
MKTAVLLLIGSTLLAGCATQPLTTEDAIRYAAAVAPDVYSDTYVMTVQATGRDNGRIFLNSQADYRDPHNLSIEILPAALPRLQQVYGEDADTYLKGRRITVLGEAKACHRLAVGNRHHLLPDPYRRLSAGTDRRRVLSLPLSACQALILSGMVAPQGPGKGCVMADHETGAIVPRLEDGTVILRPLRPDDAVGRLALGRDPEIYRLMGWDGGGDTPPFTQADADTWLADQMKFPSTWAIALPEPGAPGADGPPPDRLLGTVRLGGINGALPLGRRVASLGIGLLDPAVLDRGLGMRVMRLLLPHAFGAMGLHRVGLRVLAFNTRAIHCYEKLGFRIEGRERQAYFLTGQWHDSLVMGLLAEEYQP